VSLGALIRNGVGVLTFVSIPLRIAFEVKDLLLN
jgi:hypothetical protein